MHQQNSRDGYQSAVKHAVKELCQAMEQRVSRASPQSESLLSKLLIQQRANLSSDQCGHESAVEEQMCVLSAYHDSIKA